MPITFKIPTISDRYGFRINFNDSGYDSADSTSSPIPGHSTRIGRSHQRSVQPNFGSASSSSSPCSSPQPLPTTSSAGSHVRKMIDDNPTRIRYLRDSVVNILDQIDTRVCFLRETAQELEEEKLKLLGVLNSLKSTDDLSLISEVDKEEIFLTADCLIQRLQSVEIVVTTLRNEDQRASLDQVNGYIDRLVSVHRVDPRKGIELCQLYLNTCSPDSHNMPIDDKFQSSVLACAAKDQKRIRKRLEALLTTFDHSAKTNAQ